MLRSVTTAAMTASSGPSSFARPFALQVSDGSAARTVDAQALQPGVCLRCSGSLRVCVCAQALVRICVCAALCRPGEAPLQSFAAVHAKKPDATPPPQNLTAAVAAHATRSVSLCPAPSTLRAVWARDTGLAGGQT